MCGYITSARGHELSGRVRAHAYNYYAWAECTWVAICDHALCILWSYCLAGYTYTALHSSYHIGEPSLIPKLLLPCVYDTMIMQFYY